LGRIIASLFRADRAVDSTLFPFVLLWPRVKIRVARFQIRREENHRLIDPSLSFVLDDIVSQVPSPPEKREDSRTCAAISFCKQIQKPIIPRVSETSLSR
jgi:hypothetical protein